MSLYAEAKSTFSTPSSKGTMARPNPANAL